MTLKDEITALVGEIGAAHAQRHWIKDEIVAERIERAYDKANALLERVSRRDHEDYPLEA